MFAMRPALYHREFCPSAEKPGASAAPTGIAPPTKVCGHDLSPELAIRIARARRDARLHPEQAALLLRSWMTDHG
jgi:hypothetical protein